MDTPDITTLLERIARLERDLKDARDQLVLEMSVNIRTAFAPFVRDLREIKDGLDRIRELTEGYREA